ncbi:hypothetical protein P3W33_12450 [Luteibacter sp. PPL552]
MTTPASPSINAAGQITNADVAANAAIEGTKLQFLQAGTSTLARTQQSKSRERVTPEDFGADGTGSSDATAAIQAAVDSLGTGGGEVFFLVDT